MDKTEELYKKTKMLRDELKAHAQVVEDPKCAALCETAGEVVGGLESAFDHFLQKSEKAWQ
ncbi:hypothetical protein C5B42_02695 [Candidatus Cerribacteria bacterium 'Amazon FNV 2010 28 9']|uniref:Uncharacterized protein n=1 Tax=Candidatus Cerribacteria bacterium 'Amazon FNV 2010 28 9' TaxID=2081795 RepID=A0A317JP34_9BACT|nr:MAG: hypothetical protein C5B42_02695 [Candidatus Cerribacteria bacterium 'Amazon FNV 2010 28 9']